MYNVHLTHSLLCFEFVEFTFITLKACPNRQFQQAYSDYLIFPSLTKQQTFVFYQSLLE